jgi:hypothetical protein
LLMDPETTRSVIDSLAALAEHPEVIAIYQRLYYNGVTLESRDLQIAKSMFRLHQYFREIIKVPMESKMCCIKISRSSYHPHGSDVQWIDPLQPPIRILSRKKKLLNHAKLFFGSLSLLPLCFFSGVMLSVASCLTIPPWYFKFRFFFYAVEFPKQFLKCILSKKCGDYKRKFSLDQHGEVILLKN